MPGKNASPHPLSLTQKQCALLLMLGAPITLPGTQTWRQPAASACPTVASIHTSIHTFYWKKHYESESLLTVSGYTCVIWYANLFHRIVLEQSALGSYLVLCPIKGSLSVRDVQFDVQYSLWNVLVSENLQLYEVFSGTGRIHAEASQTPSLTILIVKFVGNHSVRIPEGRLAWLRSGLNQALKPVLWICQWIWFASQGLLWLGQTTQGQQHWNCVPNSEVGFSRI